MVKQPSNNCQNNSLVESQSCTFECLNGSYPKKSIDDGVFVSDSNATCDLDSGSNDLVLNDYGCIRVCNKNTINKFNLTKDTKDCLRKPQKEEDKCELSCIEGYAPRESVENGTSQNIKTIRCIETKNKSLVFEQINCVPICNVNELGDGIIYTGKCNNSKLIRLGESCDYQCPDGFISEKGVQTLTIKYTGRVVCQSNNNGYGNLGLASCLKCLNS